MPDKAPDFGIICNGVEITDLVKSHLGSLVYDESLEATAKLEFGIRESEAFSLDPEDFKLGTSVELYMGYTDGVSKIFEGEIGKVSPEFPLEDPSVLKVIAYDQSYKLKRVSPPKIYKGPDLKAIAEEISKKHGLKIVVDPPGPLSDFSLEDDQSIEQIDETDWEILDRLAQVGNYKLFVKFDTLYLVQKKYLVSNQSEKFRLIYRPTEEELQDFYARPLLEFFPEIASDQQRLKVEVISWAAIDSRGKKYGKMSLSEAETKGEAYTEVKVKTEVIETMRIVGKAARTTGQAKMIAQGELQRRADGLIKGMAVIMGNPLVQMGQEHELVLRDLGKFSDQYSGDFFLTGVRHQLDLKGYLTFFDVRRTGLTSVG